MTKTNSTTRKRKKILFLLDKRIKWSTYKLLQEKCVRDSGPTPKNAEKILWKMNKDGEILLFFAEDLPNDMGVGLQLPERYKDWEIKLIQSAK